MKIENEILETLIFHTKNFLADLEAIKQKAGATAQPLSSPNVSAQSPPAAAIAQLKNGDKKVSATAKATAIAEPRHAGEHIVQDVTISDQSGTIKLVLFDDEVGKVRVGDTATVENGYVSSYKGTLQLNVGKWGKIKAEAKQ